MPNSSPPSAESHLEVGRSKPTSRLTSRPRNPLTGIRGLSYSLEMIKGKALNKTHVLRSVSLEPKKEVAGVSVAVAQLDAGVELGVDLPCRKFDPDLWFADSPAELELAKSMCGECPLRLECLAGAVERAEPWGVWGGEIFERGAIVARKRPRGRPRKADRTEVAA